MNPITIPKTMEKELKEIYKNLLGVYGYQGWWPLFNEETGKIEYHPGKYSLPENDSQRFEICLGAILAQNTSWKNVEKALGNLRKNNLLNKEEIKLIETKKLAGLIKSSGYNNQKAKKIKEFIIFLDSKKEINRENLLGVWGIGKETADSILLYAYSKPIFVIDSYTKRIFSRLGFCEENINYNKLQDLFHENLGKDTKLFNEYHALIVEHAKRFCRKKPLCRRCSLNNICNFYKTNESCIVALSGLKLSKKIIVC